MRFFILSIIFFALLEPRFVQAQIQSGTIECTLADQTGALVRGAEVTLNNLLTGYRRTATERDNQYVFDNVPFGTYSLRVRSNGFQPIAQNVLVRSNIPVVVNLKLDVSEAAESVDVNAEGSLVQPDSASTETNIDESFIKRLPAVRSNRELQQVIATTPGWRTENDGLLHVRGVDSGTLYVIDGIPVSDRVDVVSGNSYDTEAVNTLDVVTGNIPAEFGGRSGAIVMVQSKSMIGESLTGGLSFGSGNFRAGEVNAQFGGSVAKKLGVYVTGTALRSHRFLDPVDPRNFNNLGGAIRFNLRSDWRPTARDTFLLTVSTNGSDFHITNDPAQELAGQRQRQELRDNSESLRWQHVWSSSAVVNLAYFRQSYDSRLIGSAFDTPLFADQNRRNTRQGLLLSLTKSFDGHTVKAGAETSRLALREFFSFAVTDREAAREREISEEAIVFDVQNPFVFNQRSTRALFSGYLQDSFSPLKNLTLNAGVRYDHSSLLVSDQQFSPRLGAVYYIPATKTAVRGSFNRLYMPPQVENLLLSSSEEARRLSPFAGSEGGGAVVRPEKISAFEVGFAQEVLGIFRLDGAFWSRSFRNYGDPNVFFNTTIIFPNSVASGFARGVDVRIDVPERKGFSGYLSYGNARIQQTGPINGGLFLTDDFLEIGPGTHFVPDHDERNTVSYGATYNLRTKHLWASFLGRYESGVPVEAGEEKLEELQSAPGADLVNFARRRVKPWSVLDFSVGREFFAEKIVAVQTQFAVQNIFNRRFVYNFGNPFSGTHFGYPRLWEGRIKFVFH